MKTTNTVALLLAVVAVNPAAGAQQRPSHEGLRPRAEVTVDWSKIEHRIAWYGTLELARAAALKTGRPLLLVAGAPHCGAVPGVW